MPLAVYVFSGILFLLGGLLTVFEGANLGSVARQIPAGNMVDEPVFAEIPQKIQKKPAELVVCARCSGRQALPDRVRPVAKPSQTVSVAQHHEERTPGAFLINEAQWEYAVRGGMPGPYYAESRFGFSPVSARGAVSEQDFQGGYWVQPAVLEPGSVPGFNLEGSYLDVSEAGDTCWTENYGPAGAAWIADDCRPHGLQAEDEVADQEEPSRSAYRVGFTTKIRHSVVGLRISRKLN